MLVMLVSGGDCVCEMMTPKGFKFWVCSRPKGVDAGLKVSNAGRLEVEQRIS